MKYEVINASEVPTKSGQYDELGAKLVSLESGQAIAVTPEKSHSTVRAALGKRCKAFGLRVRFNSVNDVLYVTRL